MKTYYLLLLVAILGLLFIVTTSVKVNVEGFGNQCPDILVEKEGQYYLYNSKLVEIPGVNPVKFNNLEDYVEYLEWQRGQDLKCPILFLQQSYDAQGSSQLTQRPSPMELNGGLPPTQMISEVPMNNTNTNTNTRLLMDSNRNDPPYNTNSYPGFDPDNQNIGVNTPLDNIFHQNFDGNSPNPMDTNWAGHEFTKSLIDNDYYAANNVYKQSH